MRAVRLFIVIGMVGMAIGAPVAAGPVDDVVSLVSTSQYTHYLSDSNFLYTHDGDNRGIGGTNNHHDDARANILSTLGGFGLTSTLDPFTYNSTTYYNVVAEQRGTVYPERVFIVGAHYDSAGTPGADDNASGVAGLLEIARVLSQFQFAATIRYIAFDREEQGLAGSWAYTFAHKDDQIQGMVALDMIAYNPDGAHHDKVYLYYDNNLASAPQITTDLASAFAEYSNGISAEIAQMSYDASDYAPFANMGFEAAMVTEHAIGPSSVVNPYYHTALDSVDTLGYIDYTFAADVTRGVAGYLAEHAMLVPEPSAVVLLVLGAVGIYCACLRSLPASDG